MGKHPFASGCLVSQEGIAKVHCPRGFAEFPGLHVSKSCLIQVMHETSGNQRNMRPLQKHLDPPHATSSSPGSCPFQLSKVPNVLSSHPASWAYIVSIVGRSRYNSQAHRSPKPHVSSLPRLVYHCRSERPPCGEIRGSERGERPEGRTSVLIVWTHIAPTWRS